MARAINSIPTLKGKEAVRFERIEKKQQRARATVNFQTQAKTAHAILKKAQL